MNDAARYRFRSEQVHPSVFVADGARIVGDVTIGEGSSIWFNAVLRGDTEPITIGRRTNIQDGCVVHTDPGFPCTIADGVTVGHAAVVHGARVGDNVTIGMHAVIMSGAVIGENSIVGVGAIVTEGTQVPAGSLVVGLPAKVKRSLAPEEIDHNRQAAKHYVERAARYREEGRRDG